MIKKHASSVWPLLLITLVSCAPTLKVATPDPVKIDVNMRVDVYTQEAQKKEEPTGVSSVDQNRRLRMGEVQTLKNDRVVGENRGGYLSVVKVPADKKYAEYAQKIVEEENNDRQILYSLNAQKQGKPLAILERESALVWHQNAFPGELIQKEDGQWVNK